MGPVANGYVQATHHLRTTFSQALYTQPNSCTRTHDQHLRVASLCGFIEKERATSSSRCQQPDKNVVLGGRHLPFDTRARLVDEWFNNGSLIADT